MTHNSASVFRHNLLSAISFIFILAVVQLASCTAEAQWEPIGWGQTSNRAPQAVNYQEEDVYVYHANDGTTNLWYSIAGGSPHLMPRTASNAAPALVVFAGELYIFHTGTDGNIYWDTLDQQGPNPQTQWNFEANWNRLTGIVKETDNQRVNPFLRPAVAIAHNLLYIGGTFNDGTMRFVAMDVNQHFNTWQQIPGNGVTSQDIDFAGVQDSIDDTDALVAIHRGTDSRIYYNILGPDFRWNSSWTPEPGGGTSNSGPAGLAFQSYLYIAVHGNDNRVWRELLFYDALDRRLTLIEGGTQGWTSITSHFTDSEVGLAYLQGNGPLGLTNPTVLADLSDLGNLIERFQLN